MSITARHIIDRTQHGIGITWIHGTDICEAGNPNTPVTGVATSFIATFEIGAPESECLA
jgi:hypothetical protein